MDDEVKQGAKMVIPAPFLLMERCHRFLKLEKLGAPDMIIDEERRLIMKAVLDCKPEEIAHAMRDFPSNAARFERISAEVEAEHPPYPEED